MQVDNQVNSRPRRQVAFAALTAAATALATTVAIQAAATAAMLPEATTPTPDRTTEVAEGREVTSGRVEVAQSEAPPSWFCFMFRDYPGCEI